VQYPYSRENVEDDYDDEEDEDEEIQDYEGDFTRNSPEPEEEIQEVAEQPIMADTVFEVQSSGLGPEGPQCMSSPLQSPTEEDPHKNPDGHMTMKSDDSGIMMDESTFSMNDTMHSGSDDVSSPEAEEKPLTNGHSSSDHEDQEEVQEVTEKKSEAIDSLVAALTESDDGKVSPVPQITVEMVDSPEQEEEVEQFKLELEEEGTQVVEEVVEASKVEEKKDEASDEKEETEAEKKEETEEPKKEEEEEEESESEEEEEEDDGVEFVKDVDKECLKQFGIRCTDAYAALEILNTKYRLTPAVANVNKPIKRTQLYHTLPRTKASKKQVRAEEKNKAENKPMQRESIITWSSWNISDMVHAVGSQRPSSCWAKPIEQTTEDKDENENIKDLNTSISTKDDEIKKLYQKVLDDEKKKKEQEERLKDEENKAKEPAKPVVEDKIDAVEIAPIEAVAAPKTEEAPKKKKKKGNVFQRMVRSIQKRFGGNQRNRTSTKAA